MKSNTVRLMVILSIIIMSSNYIGHGQNESFCADYHFDPRPIDNLPGTMVIRDNGLHLLNFIDTRVIRQQIPTEFGYQALSNDGRWVITSTIVRNESLEPIQTEFWMYDMVGNEEPLLLLVEPGPVHTSRVNWTTDHRLIIQWGGPFSDYRRTVRIDPFAIPIEYLELETFLDDWYIWSYSPDNQHLLIWREFQYSVYDIQTRTQSTSFRTVSDLVPQWSSDGRLAYPARTGIDENARSEVYDNYQEIFVYDVSEGTQRQISNIEDEYGVVSIARQFTWSPDGRYIGFKMTRFDILDDTISELLDNVPLYIVDTQSDEIIPLCIVPKDNRVVHFFWSPDSQYIGFIYNDDLVVVNVETRVFSIIEENIGQISDWR